MRITKHQLDPSLDQLIMVSTKTTSKDYAGGLLYALHKSSDSFYDDFAKRAQEILGIKLDDAQLVRLRREIYTINLWIISKVLGTDKKALDELHQIYLSPHSNCSFLAHLDDGACYGSFVPHTNQEEIGQWIKLKDTGKLKEVFRQDNQELNERYRKYFKEWDDNSSMQNVLALTMLEYMLNNGQPDKSLLDFRLSIIINLHISLTMKAILDVRRDYEISD